MARTICIANQKGGVGKTTSSVNIASSLASLGRRVLLIDMDPQGNASSGLGVKRYENQESSIYHALIGEKELREVIQTTENPRLCVASANPDLVGAEIELVDVSQREYRLKQAIATVSPQFDYIIIDCPPSLGLLTVNSLSAADTFLVPLQCEYYALEGLSQLLNTAGLIKKNLNPQLKIEGILLTMFDTRNNLSHQVVKEIQTHFGDKVFKAVIPRNVRLSEAPSHGKSILDYDPKSIGAQKYLDLAHELDAKVFGKFGNEPEISLVQASMRDENRSTSSELGLTDSPNYAENEANV
ncbi:MAG: ParA family protein [Bdellovibrionales bacterium]|nr:ParA family protein [Bdellovibrionales bacterium]